MKNARHALRAARNRLIVPVVFGSRAGSRIYNRPDGYFALCTIIMHKLLLLDLYAPILTTILTISFSWIEELVVAWSENSTEGCRYKTKISLWDVHRWHSNPTNSSRIRTVFWQNGENGTRKRERWRTEWSRGGDERARATGCERARQRRHSGGSEREKSTKFISGHPRAEPRPGTNSIASVALFREQAHGTLAGTGIGRGWMVGSLAGDRTVLCFSLPPLSHPPSPVSSPSPYFVRRDPA